MLLDYYPFGMLVPNRHKDSPEYRYGFQGQEKDDEIRGGDGNSLNYTFRMHDPRIGRFFAKDPLEKKYPELSPYQFSSNTPIMAIELEGLETAFEHSSDKYYGSSAYLHATTAERSERAKMNGLAAVLGVTTLIDIYVTKGWLSRTATAYIMGDLTHSAQMQTYYRDQGNEFRAKQYEKEGADATKILIFEGASALVVKGVGKLANIANKMNRGGSKLISTSMLESHPSSSTFGDPAETFISSSKEIDALLSKGFSREKIMDKLGIKNPKFLEGDLIRVDITINKAKELNIRSATGKEIGANSNFVPGGKTSGGITESVVNGIPKNDIQVTVSKVKEK